jgi:tRNA uridine 5-carboxymethylaminomethyl modification enzyme
MPDAQQSFDVIVIGGGHAGCEAYAAACRVGVRTALVLPSIAEAACQPCNPAVGGLGKGHLVREVVTLGGLMGRITDRSGLQFRTLNRRKGPAVRGTRVQTDSGVYMAEMAQAIRAIPGGTIIEDRAVGLTWSGPAEARQVDGVVLGSGRTLKTRTAVVAAGTFLRGSLFIGDEQSPGGRRGRAPAVRLAESLAASGLPLIRLKTGTCPRLDGRTINTDGLFTQPGESPPPFFDPGTTGTSLPQRNCFLTYTGEKTHEVVRQNMGRSALYSGAISGIGPRYCPSFETKVARFPDKPRHQVFLEPEDQHGAVIYPSGIPTSLPREVQDAFVHSIPGLERARIVRYGYAVEYDAVQPTVCKPTLEVDQLGGLFLVGQILGTSGYEEAAALGLIGGANAALQTLGAEPLVLGRDQAYAGVMVDDLTTVGVDEPYRMFTSRAEYRLLLREDNADDRLIEAGVRTGLVGSEQAQAVRAKRVQVQAALERLAQTRLNPSNDTVARLRDAGLPTISKPTNLYDLLRRNDVGLDGLKPLAPWLDSLERPVRARVEVDVKYAGYLDHQQAQADKLRHLEKIYFPDRVDFSDIPGLRAEAVEKLSRAKPATVGQASRIPGITPAALQILRLFCERPGRG